MKTGGLAHMIGVRVGDVLLSVNNAAVDGRTHDGIIALLGTAATLHVEVARRPKNPVPNPVLAAPKPAALTFTYMDGRRRPSTGSQGSGGGRGDSDAEAGRGRVMPAVVVQPEPPSPGMLRRVIINKPADGDLGLSIRSVPPPNMVNRSFPSLPGFPLNGVPTDVLVVRQIQKVHMPVKEGGTLRLFFW